LSDNWIALIPEDPYFVPSEAKQVLALNRFMELAPDADQIEIILSDKVRFFDCGANFERVTCPSCNADVPIEWWQGRMDADFENDGYTLRRLIVPCCGSTHTLHTLNYEWPQGFGRFAIDAMNPNLGMLNCEVVAEFESILEVRLRVIYQHI
jgi:hypothetical protein